MRFRNPAFWAIGAFLNFLVPKGEAQAERVRPVQTPASSSAATPRRVLPLLLRETPKPNYDRTPTGGIRGTVFLDEDGNGMRGAGERGVPGVAVSDGYTVLRTGVDGTYEMESSRDSVFIQVTKPSGYRVAGDWYKPVEAVVDFALVRSAQDEDDYTFVHVTDTHVGSRESMEGVTAFVEEVNGLKRRPLFVVNSGDLINLAKALTNTPEQGHAAMRNYVGLMNHLAMTHYAVAGDHADSSYRLDQFPRGDHRAGKALFWEYLGPHFASFEYGRIHFVLVDYVYHLGTRQLLVNGKNLEYPVNEIQPVHLRWLRQDLVSRSAGTMVVTASENNLVLHCPGFIGLAQENDIRFQLTGDDHIVAYNQNEVPYRSAGALAGCWWSPKAEGRCPDLSPQGYMIYRVKGAKMECFYKGLGRRLEFVALRFGTLLRGRAEISGHIVEPLAGEGLEYRFDGGDWKPLPETGRPFYRSLHTAWVDTKTISDGLRTIYVRSTVTGEMRSQTVVIANGAAAPDGGDAAVVSFSVGTSGGTALGRDPEPLRAPAGDVNVLLNGQRLGKIPSGKSGMYSFPVEAASLKVCNILSFDFVSGGDGMNLADVRLTFRKGEILDPRDTELRRLRTAFWGPQAAGWGAFNVGDGGLAEGPFFRKQDEFTFVIAGTQRKQ
jgi:hypothetical protein